MQASKGTSVRFKYQTLYRPGRFLNDQKITELSAKLIAVGESCFSEIPHYQVFKGSREAFDDKVLAIAWDGDVIAGFCSLVILKVPHVGDVVHLGLTCVRPEYRSSGLTHRLTPKAMMKYLWRTGRLFGKVWVSNCAAVLGSLVNVYLHFDSVFPAPGPSTWLTSTHVKIAEAIDRLYRSEIYINDTAIFDYGSFVFKGSIKNTPFEKKRDDRRFYHRNVEFNEYYMNIMDFSAGDETLQIGYATLFTYISHIGSGGAKKLKKFRKKGGQGFLQNIPSAT